MYISTRKCAVPAEVNPKFPGPAVRKYRTPATAAKQSGKR